VVGRWTCDQEVAGSTPGRRIVEWQLWASCSHPCASVTVGAGDLVGEYQTGNFHFGGANLARAMSVCCTAGPIVRHRGQWMAA